MTLDEAVLSYFSLIGVDDLLNQDQSEMEITELVKQLCPLELNSEISQLYRVCNGSTDDSRLFYYSTFSRLEDCFYQYEYLKTMFKSIDLIWPDRLFPIGLNDGAFLVTVLSSQNEKDLGVYYLDIGSGDLTLSLEANSMSQLIEILKNTVEVGGSKFKFSSDLVDKFRIEMIADPFISDKPSTYREGVNFYDLKNVDSIPDKFFA